ncbi:hypothetical protein DMUE_4272 [Dictyocoela muelleri]|nr:hypothetical protein DMUE_4272 [Dictyocoela muelleri]
MIFENQNNHNNVNQAFKEDKICQSFSKNNNDETFIETSKYPQNEKYLLKQPFDYLSKKNFEFQQYVKNNDLLEIHINSDYDKNNKNLKRSQELIKDEKLKQNFIPIKITRIDSSDINISDNFFQTNNVFTPQSEAINIRSNFSNTIKDLKPHHKLSISDGENLINTNNNDKITKYGYKASDKIN